MHRLKTFLQKHKLLPSYGEETIFLILISIVTIIIINPVIRDGAASIITHGPKSIIYGGVFYIISTTLFSYFRTEKQKIYMFCFVLLANACSIYAVIIDFKQLNIISLLFLLINIFIFLSSITLLLSGELHNDSIPNRAARYANVLYGSLVVIALVLIGKYKFLLSWNMLFSFSVGYAMLFNQYLIKYIPPINAKRSQDIDAIEALVEKALVSIDETPLNFKYKLFCTIVSDQVRTVLIPEHYREDVFPFFERELAQENRTTPFVAVIWNSFYEYKRLFSKRTIIPAVAVNVYPNTGKKGYQFVRTTGPRSTAEKLIYTTRVENIFVRKPLG